MCFRSFKFNQEWPAILKMGRKRKRGQTKQSLSSSNTRKQRKRRNTRGHGLKQSKISREFDGSQVKLSNTTGHKMLELISREKSSSSSSDLSSCTLSPDKDWNKVRFCGINTIFSRLHTIASMLQRSTMECFRSIRNFFLLLNWLKQLFGCGLQRLGKVSWMHAPDVLITSLSSDILLLFLTLIGDISSFPSDLVFIF